MAKVAIYLIITFGFIISNTLCLHSSCNEYFEGFSLPDDYNRNIPDKNIVVNNVIHIHEVLEVSRIELLNHCTSFCLNS